ncbi:GntR family transcriptional regulator [Microbacterium paludicola]|uniref:GntR family transcriptional regulator n=1 Tax=Microbacterium paludicola TaxID=300019 RepID=UPI0011A3A99E|nr:GntR family transcriptional regulator [Microbacterium paludicola]
MPIPRDDAARVGRSLLRDDVYTRLRDAIVDYTFEPGEQLRDVELAEWLGVSRTPIREALLRLAASGLVVTKPGRSTTVAEIDEQAAGDARDVIAAMHALAARTAAGRLSQEQVEGMRDANRRFADAVAAGDTDAANAADDELHRIPIVASGNRAAVAVIDQYDPLVRRMERRRFGGDGTRSVELHDRLIEHLAAGESEQAAEVAFEIWHTLPSGDGSED